MARHSHWHNIQIVKGKADAARAKVFTKMAREITVAAREGGGDPASNARLKTAIAMARDVSMPKDNIERAIARGVGGGSEGNVESVRYEGFGPGGTAWVVVALTDNRARTAANVKIIFSKHEGSVSDPNAVMWMFDASRGEEGKMEYTAKTPMKVDTDTTNQIRDLVEALEEDDDVQDYFTNAEEPV
ncbi:YebC/PmpR family DNA-binding transcriptional regulator [Candidatus Uhrbacteria bacterium]|nr:YebC/PmpR family DNA-binding transcriptional regulator [Candidatus Uhrbacteria bacterium]